MILAVGNLPLDADVSQKEILVKHVLDIGIDLSHRIYILHGMLLFRGSSYAIFPRTPLINPAVSSPPFCFPSSTASLMATPVGISSSYFSS